MTDDRYRDRPLYRLLEHPVFAGAVGVLGAIGVAVTIWFAAQASLAPQSAGVTTIEPDESVELTYVDPEALPEVYTGQLVDFTQDGSPDVALFGDPDAPVIRPIRETRDRTGQLITAGSLVVVAVISVTGTWAVSRRSQSADRPAADGTG